MLHTRHNHSFLSRGFGLVSPAELVMTRTGRKTLFGAGLMGDGSLYSTPKCKANEKCLSSKVNTAKPVIYAKTGSGLFDWIRKAAEYVVPLVKKGWEVAQNIGTHIYNKMPAIKNIYNQGKDLITGAIDTIKKPTLSGIQSLIDKGKTLFNNGQTVAQPIISQVKDGVKSMKDILNHNENMKKAEQKVQMFEIAKQSRANQIDNIREATVNNNVNKVLSNDPNIQVVGGETLNPIGSGFISKLLNKTSDKMFKKTNRKRGTGILTIH
ncbi:MAG: hypothetical protein RBS48_06160 [Ignavibacteriaceae bacterium]|nr:hypothetical protein [Ignavibacteriaceae bacterium]